MRPPKKQICTQNHERKQYGWRPLPPPPPVLATYSVTRLCVKQQLVEPRSESDTRARLRVFRHFVCSPQTRYPNQV